MISPAAWRAQGAFLEWRGLRVFHRCQGRGEPLLLLHGFPTSSWDWKDVWERLVAWNRVVAFDYVGFGFSDKPPRGPYSVFGYADQAEALLEHLGIDAPHILAHDLGDTVAQELLARSPRRFRSVCLLNGGIFPEMHRPRLIQRLLASPLGPLIGRLMNRERFEKSFRSVFGKDTQPSAAEMDGFWECVEGRVAHLLIGYMRERRQHRERWVSALLDESVSLALVDGLADPISGAQMVARLRELRPGARITALDGIGHYPQIEAPEAVLSAYAAFRASL
jgi:pimeloyl-ACP methyl ester carboxylesterase